MAWVADLVAVRGLVVDSVLAVWPGITVAVDAPEREFDLPFARVVTRDLEFHSDSVLTDRLAVLFEIRVRRTVPVGVVSEVLLADAEDLREQLLSSPNPAGVGGRPMIGKVWIEQCGGGDGEFEMRMEFGCDLCATRGA